MLTKKVVAKLSKYKSLLAKDFLCTNHTMKSINNLKICHTHIFKVYFTPDIYDKKAHLSSFDTSSRLPGTVEFPNFISLSSFN